MKLLLPTALALLFLPALLGAQEPDADALFEKAVRLHQAGDNLGAVSAYKSAIEKQPRRVAARSNLGAVYVRLGRFEDAIAQYQAALKIEPGNAAVRFNLALALYKTTRIREAAEELTRVTTVEPRNRNAVVLLADCQLQMGQYGQVVGLLSPREAELGDDRLFTYLLGTALIHQDDLTRGQRLIDRLLRDPNSAEAHLLLGAAYVEREDYRAALPEVQRAVELDPSLPTVHSLLGRVLMYVRRADDAAQAFRQELERNPNDFDSNLQLGLFAQGENRLDEAMTYLERAGRLRPEEPSVLYGLARVHLAAERVEQARQALETLTERVPNYTRGHVLLAQVYYRLKLTEKAARERAIVEKLLAEEQAREQREGIPRDPAPGAAGPTEADEPPAAGRREP
jgi:tetratricopeptide (TPR) repeat protein